jgi:hypothetical protein
MPPRVTHGLCGHSGALTHREPQITARLAHADLWVAFFRDTEGNLLALQSEVARD